MCLERTEEDGLEVVHIGTIATNCSSKNRFEKDKGKQKFGIVVANLTNYDDIDDVFIEINGESAVISKFSAKSLANLLLQAAK